MTQQRMRVVVCGTRFGQVYLEAFRDPELPFELAGVLATGSQRSRDCARHYGVPLYTDPEALPDDIDVACVVIRGGLLGGGGSELARRLMSRGIHVLQEHPLHHDELAESLRHARKNRVMFALNSFYVNVAPVRRFLAAAQELTRDRPPLYVTASCGFQMAYSLLDILGQVLRGVRPWAFAAAPELPERVAEKTSLPVPFRSLDGVLGGVPISLRVQNQMDPADPDNYAHLMHRVTIGVEAGSLTLVGTHGPVVWNARPDFPREVGEPTASPHFGPVSDGSLGHATPPSATVIGPAEVPDYATVFGSTWPRGVGRALRGLRDAIDAGEDPLRRGQYHLSLCQLWQDITALLGPPELLSSTPPRMLSTEDLKGMVTAAEAVDGP
jgi:thiazolinyl imide reductase